MLEKIQTSIFHPSIQPIVSWFFISIYPTKYNKDIIEKRDTSTNVYKVTHQPFVFLRILFLSVHKSIYLSAYMSVCFSECLYHLSHRVLESQIATFIICGSSVTQSKASEAKWSLIWHSFLCLPRAGREAKSRWRFIAKIIWELNKRTTKKWKISKG